MDDMHEIEVDKKINPEELDVEVLQQADLFYKWAERAINKKSEAELAEFRNEVLEARLQIECREDPDAFGIDAKKVTETAIKSAVLINERYIDSVEAAIELRRQAALMDKAVGAMETKRRMLEELVKLHGQQFFAGPDVPHNLTEAWEARQRRAEQINGKQKETARRRVRSL